jgi:hypothetical protein
MRKRQQDGRFVSGPEVGKGMVRVEVDGVEAPRAKACRTYTRKRVAEALPEIVETFLKKAKHGSVPHAREVMQMGGLVERNAAAQKVEVRWRGKSIAERLLEDVGEEPQG